MENLANYTSLRVGGPAQKLVHATTEHMLIEAVKSADSAGEPVLIIGGGSNVLIGDQGFSGTVIRVETKGNSYQFDACSGGTITVNSGENWDSFVGWLVAKGFADIETLSGIPGTVGGAPIQNIGAYGHEICEVIARVRTWDRKISGVKTFTNQDCEFGYRTSRFKRERDRYVVLDVTFQIRKGDMSLPIKYQELANYLGVQLGERVPVNEVRDAVLALRAAKGMLLNEEDPDTWSAGSFFINPILSLEAMAKLPMDAPRWPQPDGRIKTSAAWLMERAGIKKGETHEGARVSTKHVLALVNSGNASARDIAELAKSAQTQVKRIFGITLEPEVYFVGLSLD